MEVRVEKVDVLDHRGLAFYRVHGGIASYTGKDDSWHQGVSVGKRISSVDLPDQIFLRWQSLAEPQAYRIKIQAPNGYVAKSSSRSGCCASGIIIGKMKSKGQIL
jgi:hypothetical protein